jgi:hypothetical protein
MIRPLFPQSGFDAAVNSADMMGLCSLVPELAVRFRRGAAKQLWQKL